MGALGKEVGEVGLPSSSTVGWRVSCWLLSVDWGLSEVVPLERR